MTSEGCPQGTGKSQQATLYTLAAGVPQRPKMITELIGDCISDNEGLVQLAVHLRLSYRKTYNGGDARFMLQLFVLLGREQNKTSCVKRVCSAM